MRVRRWLVLVISLAALMAVGGVASAVPLSDVGTARGAAVTRQLAPNSAPRLEHALDLAGRIGSVESVVIPVVDAEGDAVTVAVTGPPGLSVAPASAGAWRLRWDPRNTGPAAASLTLTDEHGATRTVPVSLRATNPRFDDTMLGLGDSVASGHGLQRRDYLQRDECWRAEGEAYPALVHEGLVERGALGPDGDFHLLACSGATLADLLDDPVTGGPAAAAPDGVSKMSQVDWAVAVNPELVTLTAGANTLGFTDAWNLIEADGDIDSVELRRRRDRVEQDLHAVLTRLVDHTDARIVITNYYNPAAREPQGVDGCERACFRRRSEEVVDDLHFSLSSVAARFPRDRVELVDLIEAFEGHGAPNGLGPDGVRSGAVGWVRELIGAPLEGVHPYCAHGHDDAGSWINYVDCVHPDSRGHREIADAVLAALD